MDMFEVNFTETALQDMEEKADYIAYDLFAPQSAQRWYEQLRNSVMKYLSEFPEMYPPYPSKTRQGIRYATFGTDVVLYSVDNAQRRVYVEMVCSNGQNIDARLEQ